MHPRYFLLARKIFKPYPHFNKAYFTWIFQILLEFLRRGIAYNVSLQDTVKDSNKEKVDNKQVLRLASAVAIAFLLVEYNISLDTEGYANLFQSLVPHFDEQNKCCTEFEGLIKHFPKGVFM